MHPVFECFKEHHLMFKPIECEFCKSEINYLAHHVSKGAFNPVKRI